MIIYRGGGIEAVWPQFPMVAAIGLGFFVYSLALVQEIDRGNEVTRSARDRRASEQQEILDCVARVYPRFP